MERHEGVPCPILCRSNLAALNLAENVPYKASSMFTPTSLRSQQVAIIAAGGLLGTILVQ